MAGTGRAPKDPGQRRRFNQPARGEWVDLEPLEKPLLPEYEDGWSIKQWMWDLWRQDPVTSQWGPADLATALELAQRYYQFQDNERRLIATSLGLNPKGKRDLRWRTPQEVHTLKKADATAQVRKLRVVDDAAKPA